MSALQTRPVGACQQFSLLFSPVAECAIREVSTRILDLRGSGVRYLTARITTKAKPRTSTDSATRRIYVSLESAKIASGMVWVMPLKLPAKMTVARTRQAPEPTP